MSNINDLFQKVKDLNRQISNVLSYAKYDIYDDLSGLDINHDDIEEELLVYELRGILDKLVSAKDDIDYLSRPIKYTSELYKDESGRYDDGHEDLMVSYCE